MFWKGKAAGAAGCTSTADCTGTNGCTGTAGFWAGLAGMNSGT